MNRQEVIRDMKAEIGSFPNLSQIAKYLGKGRDTARTLVAGLEYYEDGKAKQYFVNDVADRILAHRAT